MSWNGFSSFWRPFPSLGEYACVHLSPAARNRQENLGRFLHKRRLLVERKHQISVPPDCAACEANFLPPRRKAGNPAWEYCSTASRLSAILRKSAAVIE